MFELVQPHRRRGVRRTYRGRCRAVRLGDLELVGTRILDLSPRGALVACDAEVRVGDELMMSFRAPWLGPHLLSVATVCRVVEGWRDGDPGYCAGVRFEPERRMRATLTDRLAMFPVVPASRRYPTDYAETVRRVATVPRPPVPPITFVRRAVV
jgi:hypothetical protein